MSECPKCGEPFYGQRCACGYGKKGSKPTIDSCREICSVRGCENDAEWWWHRIRNEEGKTFIPALMTKYTTKHPYGYSLLDGYEYVEQIARCDDCYRRENPNANWREKHLLEFQAAHPEFKVVPADEAERLDIISMSKRSGSLLKPRSRLYQMKLGPQRNGKNKDC